MVRVIWRRMKNWGANEELDRPTRDGALESLTKFLKAQRKLDELELQKLWRGLFYSMWFSDRPRTQQRLADDLAGLLMIINSKNFFGFLKAFWVIMAREWDSIDKHRVDKFYLLIRRYVTAALRRLQQEEWNEEWLKEYNDLIRQVPLNPYEMKIPNALRLHMFDIYIDEMERVFNEALDDEDEQIDATTFPIKTLLEPVYEIVQSSKQKLIRQNGKSYVLDDPRLKQWGAVQQDDSSDDEEEEEEWSGFN